MCSLRNLWRENPRHVGVTQLLGPSDGHVRASCEQTSGIGAGPSLVPNTLMGRHREVARRHGLLLSTLPSVCTQRQDLSSLTCLRNFWRVPTAPPRRERRSSRCWEQRPRPRQGSCGWSGLRGTARGDKRPVPWGRPGEASPAVSKRAKKGEGNKESHARAEGVEWETTTPAPQHTMRRGGGGGRGRSRGPKPGEGPVIGGASYG